MCTTETFQLAARIQVSDKLFNYLNVDLLTPSITQQNQGMLLSNLVQIHAASRHVNGLPFKNLKQPRIGTNSAIMKTLKKQQLRPKKLISAFQLKTYMSELLTFLAVFWFVSLNYKWKAPRLRLWKRNVSVITSVLIHKRCQKLVIKILFSRRYRTPIFIYNFTKTNCTCNI